MLVFGASTACTHPRSAMKFGKRLVQDALPGWEEFYINYRLLKRICQRKEPLSGGEDPDEYFSTLFYETLLAEIERVNEFYCTNAGEMSDEFDALKTSVAEV